MLCGYPVGKLLAPLLVRPFLCDTHYSETPLSNISVYNVSNTSDVVYTVSNMSGVVYTVSNTSDVSSDVNDDAPCYSAIEVPHLIVGGLSLSISLVFLAFFLAPSPAGFTLSGPKRLTLKETLSLSACKPGNRNKWYATGVLTILSFFYIAHVGRNTVMNDFTFTYATEGHLRFSKREAAWLDFAIKMSFFVGRLLNIPAMKFFKVGTVLMASNFINAVFAICLLILGRSSKLHLSVWSCLVLGLSGGNWPAGYSWMHQSLFMGGLVLGATDIIVSCTMFVFTNITGLFFSANAFDVLIYVTTTCSVLLAAITILMEAVASFGRRRAASFELGDVRKAELDNGISRPLMDGCQPPKHDNGTKWMD